jgi:hypothetical protein
MTDLCRATDQKVLTSVADINDGERGCPSATLPGRRTSRRHQQDQARIELLKRVSQVRIPPGTSRKASGPIMVRGLGELPEFRAHLALAVRSVP